MFFQPQERLCLFIDGTSLYSASRNLGFEVDYRKLLQFFRAKSNVLRAYYYSAVLDTEEYSPLKPLTDWLVYNGYTLVTKNAREFIDHNGRRRVRGNMDVELTVDMMEMAPHIDHAALFSGDSDFRRVLESVQRQGVRTTVVGSIKTTPPLIGDELRRQADQFIELADISSNFMRRHIENRVPRNAAPPVRHPADQMSEHDED